MRVRLPALALALGLLSGCAPAPAAATANPSAELADLPGELQGLTDAWRARVPVPAVTVAVGLPGEPLTVLASGEAQPDARFRVGSITKTFVAVVVLQLAEEGRLRLDDPVEDHLPGITWLADGTTVRHLLRHESGVPDYGLSAGLGERMLRDRERRWTTDEVLALVADRDLDFPPGTQYSYSNTNYVLLGRVVEAVTSDPWAAEVRRRVIDPLRLDDTFVAGAEEWRDGLVDGYFDTDGDGFTDPVGTGPWPSLETTEGPAGAIVSTAADVARFAQGLFGGRLLSPASLRAMVEPGPHGLRHTGYGLGVEVFRPDYETDVWGHGGSLPGYRAAMWFLPDHDVTIVVLTDEWRSSPADLAELVAQRVLAGG